MTCIAMGTTNRKNRTPIEELHDTRAWPKGLPMPKAGAYRRYKKWTVEEEDLVREFYYTYGPIYLARLLGRSKDAVRAHAKYIRAVKPRIWSAREIETLKREYGKHGRKSNRILAGLLGRSKRAIEHKINMLGLATPPKKWSKRELKLLHDHFGTMPIDELARKIGRNKDAVTSMASVHGLTTPNPTFTPRQKKFIADNLGKISIKNMAKRLGVSASRVMTEADRLGYRPHKGREVWSRGAPPPPPKQPNHRRQWTAEEDALIAEHYPLQGSHYTADLLGRSRQATTERARYLGISASKFAGRWTPEEDAILRKLYGTRKVAEIAREVNRTVNSVAGRINALGLPTARKRSSDSEG